VTNSVGRGARFEFTDIREVSTDEEGPADESGEPTRVGGFVFGDGATDGESTETSADTGCCTSLPDRPHDGVRSYR
jgi:hypothetical protein